MARSARRRNRQIAGRAGRFTRDGAFGETGECAPFDEDLIQRVESHEFEPVEAIQWRNAELRFETIAALRQSLERTPDRPGLARVRGADDEEVLKRLVDDAELSALVHSQNDVRRLWEACQLPDFRKTSPEEHARLAGRIAGHILSPKRRIPREWVAAELEQLDRTQGDLDMLQQRLAHVRTWTYVANRADWVDESEDFQARTRAVEDKLSDALHEALTQRFIDRRTSALLKSLKREDGILAGISEEGEVTVEGHFVGRLEGLEFVADPRALGLEGRAVRNAALKALAPEVSRRLARIAAAADEAIELGRDGRLRVERAAVAKLTPGAPLLKPRIELMGGDRASEGEREAARERLEFWLARKIAADLRPLVLLEAAWREGRLPADARGLAFRLIENSGALDRAQEDLEQVSAEALQALKRCGVRTGRHTIYLSGLIKPRAAQTLATLWHWAHHRTPTGFFLPRPGALSARLDRPVDWREGAAAGYRICGRTAVRFDIVERLGDALALEAQPWDAALARLIGRSVREVGGVLHVLGYRRVTHEDVARWQLAAPRRKRSDRPAPEDNAFATLATLLPEQTGPHSPRRRRRGAA